MAEEEENQASPQSNNLKDQESSLGTQKDNTIEGVINQGVYSLTGVDAAVSKPNTDFLTNQENQNINPNESNTSNENNFPDSSNIENTNQLQNQTDSNSEGISANAGEDENDLNAQEENPSELESLTNQLGGLLNGNQQDVAENEVDEEEEEEEEEEADDQVDPTPSTSEIPENPAKEIESGDNELKVEHPIEDSITVATDTLLHPEDENINNSNNIETKTTEGGDNESKIEHQEEDINSSSKTEPGELSNLPTDIGMSLLPGEVRNGNDQNNETSNSNENKGDETNNTDINESNENDEDKKNAEINDNANEDKNNNDDTKNDENGANNDDDEDNSTDGMMVQDEFKDSYTNWKDSSTPKIPGTASVSHLPPLETTPELDEMSKRMLDRFEQRGKLPDPEHYAQVLQYIQRQKVNSVVSNDFVSAGRYQKLSQKFITAINSTQVNESQRKKIDLLEEKLEQTNITLRDFQYETEQLIKNERYRLNDKRAQLVNIHQETLNNFEDHWNDEDFLIKYARPSSNLLQTKKIERSFVLVKDFEGAENCRKKVAELEKKESQEAQKRARSEMEKQYKILTSKQEAEIIAFDESARNQLELMTKDRSSQLEVLVARQSKLQSQLYELKNPGRQSWTSASGPVQFHAGTKGTSLGTSLPSLASGKSSKLDNLMTPRTIQRYALFKTTMKQPKLTVKPLGTINQKRKKQAQAPKF